MQEELQTASDARILQSKLQALCSVRPLRLDKYGKDYENKLKGVCRTRKSSSSSSTRTT